jgi:hypothetical protein
MNSLLAQYCDKEKVQKQTLSLLKYFAFLKHSESKMFKQKSHCHWGQFCPPYCLTFKYRKKDSYMKKIKTATT